MSTHRSATRFRLSDQTRLRMTYAGSVLGIIGALVALVVIVHLTVTGNPSFGPWIGLGYAAVMIVASHEERGAIKDRMVPAENTEDTWERQPEQV